LKTFLKDFSYRRTGFGVEERDGQRKGRKKEIKL
jgi:hypothetical protein